MVEEDKRYVSALKNGDYEAFDVLFRKYTERIYAFTLGITRQKFASAQWKSKRRLSISRSAY